MASTNGNYVVNLKDWSLPHADEAEHDLLEKLVAKICRASMGIGEFKDGPLSDQLAEREEQLYELISDELRQMSQAIVNETIDIWLRGLGDGFEGEYPELSVDFPYLQGKSNLPPLTVVYAVEGGKNARTELLRANLETALMRFVEESRLGTRQRAKTVAKALRKLADSVDKAA